MLKNFISICCFAMLMLLGFEASAQSSTPASTTTTLTDEKAKEYIGSYDTGGMGAIKVSFENGKMTGAMDGQGSAELLAGSTADVFNVSGYDGVCTFIRDSSNKVVGLRLDVQGTIIDAKRIE
jgi:hypothetical protein